MVDQLSVIRNSGRFRVLYHILFWIAYYLWYVAQYKLILTTYENWQWAVSLSVTIWPDIFAAYFTTYVLLPKLLLKKRYFLFLVSVLFSGGLFVLLQRVLLVYVDFPIIEPEYAAKVEFWDFNPFYSFINIYAIVGIFAAIKLLKFWMKEQQLRSDLEEQNKSSELAMLRSQINPHFLFNTLNNIDSLIMIDQEKASDSIIRLSEIMRYMLYDSNTDKVDLEKEVSYLRSYISLQRMRIKNPAFVTFSLEGECRGLQIAPMLFIPFVENAFKHGKKSVAAPGIVISLECGNSNVKFYVENHVDDVQEMNKDQTRGIGLKNIERRLELLYPGLYELEVSHEEDKYKIFLNIFL